MMVSKVDYIWMKGETSKPFPTFSDDVLFCVMLSSSLEV